MTMKLTHIHCHTDPKEKITASQLQFQLGFHPDLLKLYKEMGIIEFEDNCIRYEELYRLQKILRLKENFGVNTIGAIVIVDLLEKIENLQDELESLRKNK